MALPQPPLRTPAPSPRIESRKVAPRVFLTVMSGRIDAHVCGSALVPFEELLGTAPSPEWIIDTLRITGFDPAAVSLGSHWFRAFKRHGGRRIAFVSSLGAARMAARALSFSVGLEVTSFDALTGGYEHFKLSTDYMPRSASG